MNFLEKSILNTLAAIALCFIIHAIMNNFLGAIATLWIIRLLIIMVILTGIGFLGFNGYVFVQKRKLELENQRVSIAKSRYITHDTSDCLAINTERGDMQFFTNKRPVKPERTVIEMPTESPILIEEKTMTALDYAMDIDRAIVIGGTRSGKTYFCKQLAHRRIQERGDIVFALDPKDHDPDDLWGKGVCCVGAGDNYQAMSDFWKWLLAEKQRRGQDMRRTKKEPNILIFFDEINVTLYEQPDFITPYLSVLQKFAQYGIGIYAIGQADHKDGIGLPSVALKSNFDATFLFEKQNRKSYIRHKPDSCLTTPANSVLLEPYQPVRFEYDNTPLHHATPRYTSAAPVYSDISGGTDMAYQKHGSSGMPGCMAIGMQSFDNLTEEDDAVIRNYRSTGTLNKTIRAVWGSPEKSGKNPTTFAKCKAVLNKFGII